MPRLADADAKLPGGPTASPCPTTWQTAADLDTSIALAGRDIRRCVAAGGITGAAGRHGLSALAGLREQAEYDQRRAWGTRTRRHGALYERRLQGLMKATLG